MDDTACKVHVTGFGVHTGLGFGHARLLEAISKGEKAARKGFFNHPLEAQVLGFNPQVVPLAGLPSSAKSYQQIRPANMAGMMLKVILDALVSASMEVSMLRGKRVRVFCGGQGMLPEAARFLFHIHRNDGEDIGFGKKGIGSLGFDNHNQDEVAHLLRDALGLKESPLSLFAASNSGLAAAWLAYCAIKSDSCDLAIAVSFQHVSLFDLMFMSGFSGIADGKSGPFSTHGKGAILGDGLCAMVLESSSHLFARKGVPYMAIDSMLMRQSAGSPVSRGTAFAPDFRIINHVLEAAMTACPHLDVGDIACVFPHGNGVSSSDRAEAMVLQKIWGKQGPPVVSYKAQMGYLMSSSGLVDLALMSGFLAKGVLPAFVSDSEIDSGLGIHLHANTSACELSGKAGLKIGLGADGSVAVVIMRSLHKPHGTVITGVSSQELASACTKTVDATCLGVYGLSVIEPTSAHLCLFTPRWYNAWEAKMHANACKWRAKTSWLITRFGGQEKARATREIAFALELSSRRAMEEGVKIIGKSGRIAKERLALLYFDAWGQASYLEQSNSWKDSFSMDVIPWKILKELQVGAFSSKIRAGKGAFADGMRMAAYLLAADAVDAVLLGGLYRFYPVLGFSEATASAKSEWRWLGRKGAYTAPVVERVGFALLGRTPSPEQQQAGAVRIELQRPQRLPTGFSQSLAGLEQYFKQSVKAPSRVIGGLSPSLLLADLEAQATLKTNRQAAYTHIASLYGDSGGIAPLLALSHYCAFCRTGTPMDSALLCMETPYGEAQAFLLE